MGRTVLVGSTGFVGGNLLASHTFDAACHSTDVADQFGKDNGLVVYAGVPAAMYLANQDPEADLAVMRAARENLRRLAPKQAVFVSTVAVYADSRGKSESDEPGSAVLAPYGANRLRLEQWVREDFENALIVRLPALYGKGLKKNFLYDLHTVAPSMLRPEKYRELAAKSELVAAGYADAGNGFYKLTGAVEPSALRDWFRQNDWSALHFTDSRSVYQFYDLACLWGHIETALSAGLRVVNLATPPVSAAAVYRAVTGGEFKNELPGVPFDYDMRTEHADLFGGAGGYICTEQEELAGICRFMKHWEEQA